MTYTGLNPATGRAATDLDHLRQSIADILTTPLGSRVMRRDYGSQLFELVDQALNPTNRVRVIAATAGALIKWEPRLQLSRVTLSAGDTPAQVVVVIDGTYNLGDTRQTILGLRVPLQAGAAA